MFHETLTADSLLSFVVAMVFYTATYLSFVRLLKYPRNWWAPSWPHSFTTTSLLLITAGYVSISQDGFDPLAFVTSLGIIALLFGIIAAPAIAFQPAPGWVEFLARHGNHAGLWIIVPVAASAYAIPNIKFLGVLAAVAMIELTWFARHRPQDRRALHPIVGHDLSVLSAQANGNIEAFARQHGIEELVVSGGTVNWRGCERDTLPCPFNLYINRLGLNTAPCCRKHMAELCHSVAACLKDQGITHWLEGGTLLGAVRENGSILAWEDDVDLSVVLDRDMSFNTLAAVLAEYGARDGYNVDVFGNKGFIAISYDRPQAWPFSWERNRMRGEIRLDLAVYQHAWSRGTAVLERITPKGSMPLTESGNFGVPLDIVLPTSEIAFTGGDIACPNDSEKYLGLVYGDIHEVVYTYVDETAAQTRRGTDTMEKALVSTG